MGQKLTLSRKEIEMLKQEVNDPNALERNAKFLRDLFVENPEFRAILPDPLTIREIASRAERELGQTSMMNHPPEGYSDQLITKLNRETAKLFSADRLAEVFLGLAKETKIKKYKRLFLWSMSEVLSTNHQKNSIEESLVVEMITRAAVISAMNFQHSMEEFLNGKGAIEFNADKVANGEITSNEINQVFQTFDSYQGAFLFSLNTIAYSQYTKIEQPLGLRFYHILHYPEGVKRKPESQQEVEDSEASNFNPFVIQALQLDIQYGLIHNAYKQFIPDFKAALEGVLPDENLTRVMNAVALMIRAPMSYFPFMVLLYSRSGELAETLNPPDELDCIREIMADCESPSPYRKYGDLLYEKEELFGAYCAYKRMDILSPREEGEVGPKLSDELIQHMKHIERRLIEDGLLHPENALYLDHHELSELVKAKGEEVKSVV